MPACPARNAGVHGAAALVVRKSAGQVIGVQARTHDYASSSGYESAPCAAGVGAGLGRRSTYVSFCWLAAALSRRQENSRERANQERYSSSMIFKDFCAETVRYCNDYLRRARDAAALNLSYAQPETFAYPRMLVLYDAKQHFAAELLGATPDFTEQLRVVERHLPSIRPFFGEFDTTTAESVLPVQSSWDANNLIGFTIFCKRDMNRFAARYAELASLHNSVVFYQGPTDGNNAFHAIARDPDFKGLWLQDVLTMNSWKSQARARYFQAAWVVERSCTPSEYRTRLAERVSSGPLNLQPDLSGHQGELLIQSANLASLASVDKIGETTLSTFLGLNESVLLAALDGERLIPYPEFEWIEGNSDPSESSIIPDFLLVDRYGRAHLCDLKLPLLDKGSLTTGRHRRRRLVSSVMDGVAQLANYRDYFGFPSHRNLLRERYDVEIKRPRCILVVGSSENFHASEIEEAQRSLDNFELIDYDTLRAAFLARSGYIPRYRPAPSS